MIRPPPPCAAICRATRCAQKNTPLALTRCSRSQVASVTSRKRPCWVSAALFTRMSMPPSARTVRSTRASIWARSPMSEGMARLRLPSSSIARRSPPPLPHRCRRSPRRRRPSQARSPMPCRCPGRPPSPPRLPLKHFPLSLRLLSLTVLAIRAGSSGKRHGFESPCGRCEAGITRRSGAAWLEGDRRHGNRRR